MPYRRHFQLADDLIAHLNPIVGGVADPFIATRYVGFVAVAAVTVYELAIKQIFIDFAIAKHSILGTFTENYFERLNGRIKLADLRTQHVIKFGDKYLNRFDRRLDAIENASLRATGISLRSRYGNLITCRHDFAHEGVISANMTYADVIDAYESGKEIIHCLGGTMRM